MIKSTEEKIELLRLAIKKAYHKNRYEDVLQLVSSCANILYLYNSQYTDSFLEDMLVYIAEKISLENKTTTNYHKSGGKQIVFYDGFGMDRRGLILQYLDALIGLGYGITYIVDDAKKNSIPTIHSILIKSNMSKIIGIKERSCISRIKEICRIMNSASPYASFLYTTPSDTASLVSFICCKDLSYRYLVNLTDHAFWLGKNSADYFIEFRNYGACISNQYRGLPKNRIIKLPYYPYVSNINMFEGYPFKKKENNIIIFSGGSLYKTFDGKSNTYYKIVDFCLSINPNVVFWYAGTGDNTQLRLLQKKYPGRVIHTNERNDLNHILLNIDIYLNTYPHTGGLMMQYSALAGKAPITLRSSVSGGEELINEDNLGIKFNTIEEIEAVLKKMINDDVYRLHMNSLVKNAVITDKDFSKNLNKIINMQCSDYNICYKFIDTTDVHVLYTERFCKVGFENSMNIKGIITLIRYNCFLSIKCVLSKIKKYLRIFLCCISDL